MHTALFLALAAILIALTFACALAAACELHAGYRTAQRLARKRRAYRIAGHLYRETSTALAMRRLARNAALRGDATPFHLLTFKRGA